MRQPGIFLLQTKVNAQILCKLDTDCRKINTRLENTGGSLDNFGGLGGLGALLKVLYLHTPFTDQSINVPLGHPLRADI